MKLVFNKLSSTAPFLVTLPALFLIVYSIHHAYQLPYDGMDWSRNSGLVQSVLPDGPSSNLIEPGDIITKIDGVPVVLSSEPYQDKQPGDLMTFSILRDQGERKIQIQLVDAPLQKRIQRVTPQFLAFTFLLIGVIIKAFSPTTLVANLFYLLCLLASGALSSGSISALGPDWVSKWFNILVWWIGPVTVQFHLHFPQDAPRRTIMILHPLLYLVAILGSAPYLFLQYGTLLASPWLQTLFTLGRLSLAANLLIAASLLVRAYLRPTSAETRHKVRIVVLYGAIAFLLVTSLSLIPSALNFAPILPYNYSLLPLILIPLSYGYAIFRYRLIVLEKHLRRAAAYALILILLTTTLVGVLAGIRNLLPLSQGDQVVVIVLLTLIFSALFDPLRKQLQKFVDFVFYGGWYDYRSAVDRLTGELEKFNDQASLGNEITRRLKNTLKLEYALLVLCADESSLFVYPENIKELPVGPLIEDLDKIRSLRIWPHGALCRTLTQFPTGLSTSLLEKALPSHSLTQAEERFVRFMNGKLPIVITDKDAILGLFLLGPRIGGETYSSEDLNILTIVARQIGVSIQNVKLLDEIKQRAAEIDKLNQEIVRAREEEQKRLARELHDEIIQALVGLNYQLSHLDDRTTDQVKGEVRSIIENLRRITAELRPPGLDNLGLVAAIRSTVRRALSQTDLSQEIFFTIEGDEGRALPEEVATILYRVFAEALNNALKHAEAQRVDVNLVIKPDEIQLEVHDDGTGFEVPDRLGKLLEQRHFGLVGIRERVDLIQGTFHIDSNPGKGTSLSVHIPTSVNKEIYALERNG